MKAQLGVALLAASILAPATALAQDAQQRDAAERSPIEASAVSGERGVLPDDGAVDVPVGPVAQERFGEYTLEPTLESRFEATEDNVALSRPPSGHANALMIAGAALLVTGLIIGDSEGAFVAVAGAGLGAYGVYLHFR